jgi:amino acid transporter
MVLIMIPQVLINVFGIRLTAKLNDFSVYWHIAGVVVIAVLLTFFGKHHNSLGFLFSNGTVVNPLDAASADLGTGTPEPALVFGNFKMASPLFALFPASPTCTGPPPSCSCSSWPCSRLSGPTPATTPGPRRGGDDHGPQELRLGRILSVAVSAVVGYLMLLILTWTIPNGDVASTANERTRCCISCTTTSARSSPT